MNPQNILVLGGAGMVGRHLVARLSARNCRVVVPTRRRERARHLLTLPTVDVVETDIGRDDVLDALVGSADAVINLVGVLQDRRELPYGPQFAAMHVELPRRIGDACRAHGVRRLLHLSALGVGDGDAAALPSMYLRSKAAGEQTIRGLSGVAWTIFRPSVIFGPEDRFMNLFAKLQRWLPVLALARADARLQPVYVADVAQAIVNALGRSSTAGRTYELAGPDVYTLGELVRLAGRWSGHPRPILELPDDVGRLQALLLEFAPGPTLMSRDNFDSLGVPNVAEGPIAPELAITPTPLSSVAPAYLAPERTPFVIERSRARR